MPKFDRMESLRFLFAPHLSAEQIASYLEQREMVPLEALALGFPGAGGAHLTDLGQWLSTAAAYDDGHAGDGDSLSSMIADCITVQNDIPFDLIVHSALPIPEAFRRRARYYAALHGNFAAAAEWYEQYGNEGPLPQRAFAHSLLKHAERETPYSEGTELSLLRHGLKHSRACAEIEARKAARCIQNAAAVMRGRTALTSDAEHVADVLLQLRAEAVTEKEKRDLEADVVTDDEFAIALAIIRVAEDRPMPYSPHFEDPAWRREICIAAWEHGGHDKLERFRPEPSSSLELEDGETLDILVDEIRIEDDGTVTSLPPAIERHTVHGDDVQSERFVFPEPARLGHRVLDKIEVKATSVIGRDTTELLSTFAGISGKDLFYALPARPIADIRREVAAAYPHATEIVDALLDQCRDGEAVAFRPTLLVGSPGSGKTSILRAITTALGVPTVVYPCAGVSDGSFAGTPSQWATRRASTPLEAIRSSGHPNPVIVLDEIEKTGTSQAGSLSNALLPLLEKSSAAGFFEVGLDRTADLSAVSYLATANSLDGVPVALKDRFRVLKMPDPQPEHIGSIATRIVADLRAERRLHPAFMPDLAADEIGVIAKTWGGGSLRRLHRAVGATLDARERTMMEKLQ